MRFVGGLGITLISVALFPVWSWRQLLFTLGLGLLCIVFDELIRRAGGGRDDG